MKKNLLLPAVLFLMGATHAQIRTANAATNVSVSNSPAFIDASSNTTVNGSTNIGKGLLFPRVDLSAMTAFPGVTAGIANSFPTRFDGMIVYNTATSGTAGIGATSGTLSPGFWYYENKSSTNTGGTWKALGGTLSGGDNLGDHSATKNLALNDYELRLRGINDNNQSLVYNAIVNGPRLFGAGGGYLGTSNGTNALTWDNNGSAFITGDLYSGNNKNFHIRGTGNGIIWDAYNGGWYMDEISTMKVAGNKDIFTGGKGIFGSDLYTGDNKNLHIRGASNGILWDAYNGGWYMDESSTMKVAGNKNINTGGNLGISGTGTFGSDIFSGSNANVHIRGNTNAIVWDNYGGGWYMDEGSTMKVAGNKNITTGGNLGISGTGTFGSDIYSGSNANVHIRGNTNAIVWDNYGGGWYMTESTSIQAAGSKNISTGGSVVAGTSVITPRVQGPSDRRFKKDITPIYNATEKLNQLNGYTYTWKDKKEFPGQALGEGKDMGVIAQEVERVFPDAVMTNKEGYKSVNYNALIPVLIEALKESDKKIKALEDRLDHAEKAGNGQETGRASAN